MKKDIKVFLKHILESIDLIEEYTRDKKEGDFPKFQTIARRCY
jgi:uncharacterized protein with HEPN domain